MNIRLVALCALFLVLSGLLSSLLLRKYPDNLLRIVMCDVGQGDGMLISWQNTQVLIDAGLRSQEILTCLAEHMPLWDRSLEVIIVTHADADHIGGFSEVLERYQVGVVIAEVSDKTTQVAANLYTAIDASIATRGTAFIAPRFGQEIILGDRAGPRLQVISMHPFDSRDDHPFYQRSSILPPDEKESFQSRQTNWRSDENNRSIVLRLSFEQFSMYLTGDLESKGELALMGWGVIQPASVLKTGHHGAKTSSTPLFLERVAPEYSLISAGRDNKYNHPAPEVLSNLVAIDTIIKRTDELGSVLLITNGHEYWLSTH